MGYSCCSQNENLGSVTVFVGPSSLTLKKGFRLSEPSALGNFTACPAWSIRPMTGCGARLTSLRAYRNLFWQLSRDGNSHGSAGLSNSMTTSSKPSFRVPWRTGDAVVSREKAGWTVSKSGHPCPCQNCSQWHPAEKTGRGSWLNCPSCSPHQPVSQGNELN